MINLDPGRKFVNVKPRLFVGKRRKDGKIKVQYVYPMSGRRFTKIITPERLAEDTASGDYEVL